MRQAAAVIHDVPTAQARIMGEVRANMARQRVNWTHLASECGISRTTLWRMDAGKSELTLDALTAMAAALGLSCCVLLTPHEATTPTGPADGE